MANIFAKNGQLLPKARKPLYDKIVAELVADGYVAMPNGELVKTLGTVDGNPINAIVNLSVSTRTEFGKRTRTKAQTNDTEEIDVNQLFD